MESKTNFTMVKDWREYVTEIPWKWPFQLNAKPSKWFSDKRVSASKTNKPPMYKGGASDILCFFRQPHIHPENV